MIQSTVYKSFAVLAKRINLGLYKHLPRFAHNRVDDRNLHRRHLDENQRAIIAARAKEMFKEEASERERAHQFGSPDESAPGKQKHRVSSASANLPRVHESVRMSRRQGEGAVPIRQLQPTLHEGDCGHAFSFPPFVTRNGFTGETSGAKSRIGGLVFRKASLQDKCHAANECNAG